MPGKIDTILSTLSNLLVFINDSLLWLSFTILFAKDKNSLSEVGTAGKIPFKNFDVEEQSYGLKILLLIYLFPQESNLLSLYL